MNLNDRSLVSGDTATGHGMYFPFELCIPSDSGRSGGVHVLRRFLYYRFSVSRLLNHLLYFRNLDDIMNTVGRCFLFSAKR